MSHENLDKLVATLGQKEGVNLKLNSKIMTPELEDIKSNFDRVIGCDGPMSQVRKSLQLKEPQFSVGIQGFIHKKDNTNFIEVWPTKDGFLWKIPRGDEIEYGVMEKRESAKKIFEEFIAKHNLPINIKEIKAAMIPQNFIIPDNKKVTLCGDAAGLTKPWSGGGVAWSLLSSEILLKNFPDFLKYKKDLRRKFLLRIFLSKIIKKLVYFFGTKTPWLIPNNYTIESDLLV